MSDDMANATRDKWGHKVSIYLKRTQLFRRVSCSIDIEEKTMIKKITPHLLCFASKHRAVKLLAAAAKSQLYYFSFWFPNRRKLVCSLQQNIVFFANTFGCTINYIDSRANRHRAL